MTAPGIVTAVAALGFTGLAAGAAAQGADWTGFRLGASYGVGQVDVPAFDPALPGDGEVGSVYLGYDRDLGAVVLGGELEWSGSDLGTTNRDFRVTEVLRAKLRAGYDLGRFLPYVTLGATQVEALTENPPGDLSRREGAGMVLGFGLDIAVTRHLVIGAEFLTETHDVDPFEYRDNFGDQFDVETVAMRATWRF